MSATLETLIQPALLSSSEPPGIRRDPGLLPEVFPVRTSALPESSTVAPVSTVTGLVFGLKCGELLGRCVRSSSFQRTSANSQTKDSAPFLGALPKSGMMRNGRIYAQPTLAVSIGARESGSSLILPWATPTVRDHKDTGNQTNVPENALLGRQVLNWSLRGTSSPTGAPRTHGTQNHVSRLWDSTELRGSLNPEFHLWLMGYAIGWNELRPPGMQLSLI